MPSLSEVTARQVVLEAVEEFDRVGRDAFVGAHQLEPSSDYFVLHHGRVYDSKPLLAVEQVALCPNCHAVKTRGGNFVSRRSRRRVVAAVVHEQALNSVRA